MGALWYLMSKLSMVFPRHFFFRNLSFKGQLHHDELSQYNNALQDCCSCAHSHPPFLKSILTRMSTKWQALSKGTFLIPETGNEARHLYICFQMNWFLCCKYLIIHRSPPTKVSIRCSANSLSHRQIKLLQLSRTLFKQIDIIFQGV